MVCLVLVALSASGCGAIREFIARPLGRWQQPQGMIDVRTIAILPVAYRGTDERMDCDLCPHSMVMAETSQDQARLITGLFYEALSHEPKFDVVPYDTVVANLGATMDETAHNLTKSEKVDALVVAALLEMRPRVGSPDAPDTYGGAAVYAALLSVSSGQPVWAQLFDGTKRRRPWVVRQADRLIGLRDPSNPTEDEIAEYGVKRLVRSMAGMVR